MNLTVYKNLTQEQKMFFVDHYLLMSPNEFAAKFNAEFGQNRSGKWASCVAKRMEIAGYCPDGYYSIKDIVALLNVDYDTVKTALLDGRFAGHKGTHGKWFVPDDEFERMARYWHYKTNKTPWPAIETEQAASILGVTRSAVCKAAQKGYLDAVKNGNTYLVRKSHIEEMVKILKKTGAVRAPWKEFRKMVKYEVFVCNG